MGWTAWLYKFEPSQRLSTYVEFMREHSGKIIYEEPGVVRLPESIQERAELKKNTYKLVLPITVKQKVFGKPTLDEDLMGRIDKEYFEFDVEYLFRVPYTQDEEWIISRRGTVYNYFLISDGRKNGYILFVSRGNDPLKILTKRIVDDGRIPSPFSVAIDANNLEKVKEVLQANISYITVGMASSDYVATAMFRARQNKDVTKDSTVQNALERGTVLRTDFVITGSSVRKLVMGINGRIATPPRSNPPLQSFLHITTKIFQVLIDERLIVIK